MIYFPFIIGDFIIDFEDFSSEMMHWQKYPASVITDPAEMKNNEKTAIMIYN